MRKGFLIVLVVVLAAAFAAPAMAGTDINGFYKTRMFMTNFVQYYGGDYGTTVGPPRKDAATMAFVEQRMRLKVTSGDENVKAVAQFEIDSVWGDTKGNGQSASGGGLGTDATNIETKNAYVWFKIPNTPLDVTVGLQGQSDSYANVFMGGADMGGIFVNGKVAPVAFRLGWAKWSEGGAAATTANRLDLEKANDYTFYLAEAKFSPVKDVKVGGNLYVLQNDMGRASGYTQRIYMPGVDVTFGAGPATINAFAFYQLGKYRDYSASGTSDINIGGFAADARVDLNAGPGKAFAEALYISGGDDPSKKFKSIVDSGYTNSIFIRTDMQILMLAADTLTALAGLYSSSPGDKSMGLGGRGMMHAAGGFSMKMGDKLTGKVGLGYLAAVKKLKTDPTYMNKTMGTEVNASVNYTLAKGLDVGLVGAYALIGDFFKSSATDAGDPDNVFDLHARVGYVF